MSGNSNHRNSKRRKLRTRQFRPNYQEIPPSTIPSDSGSQSGSNPVQKKKFYYQTLSDSDDSVLSKTQVLDKTRNESESPTFHYPHLNSKSQDDDDEPSDFTVEDATTDESIESHELMRSNRLNRRNKRQRLDADRKKSKRNLARVNYKNYLKPTNFTQMLENECKEYEKACDAINAKKEESKNRQHSSKRVLQFNSSKANQQKLNQSDDESEIDIPKGRIFGLLNHGQLKKASCPINMDEMMKVEEDRLLEAVDEETRAAFLSTRLSVESQSNDRVSIDFKSIAGFDEHIQSLKEMIALPLMYPEIFTTFSIVPPRGVIFFGPPGTGKTLMARALVNSCSTTEKPVAFFMRKGADILSKWVGESEKQLRQLFDQAKKWQPSIIFFDEIDGLAPVRTGKQDQIHSSIVSTLLSLMDGLDSRGQVVVIGATNRIDSIDPALRRPGRFDREFYFGLPNTTARRKIIELATQSWANKPSPIELDNLAELTQGYNGADVKALCTEAALKAVRRTYPELYVNNGKYQINVSDIIVINDDFMDCLSKFTPSNERSSSAFGRAIPPHLMPLLSRPYTDILTWIKGILPLMNRKSGKYLGAKSTKTDACPPLWVDDYLRYFSPRLSICGAPGMAFDLIAAAIVDFLESNSFFIKRFDHTLLNSESMSVDTTIVQLFRELKRHQRTVLYLPDTHLWWFHIPESSRVVLLNLFEQFKTNSMMLLVSFQGDLPEPLAEAFNSSQSTTTSLMRRIFYIDFPNDESKMIYFDKLLGDIVRPSKEIIRSQVKRNIKPLESIKNPPKLDLEQHQLLLIEHVSHQRQVRQVFSTIVEDLKKSFKVFAKPIDDKIFPNINSKNVLTLNLIEDSIQSNNYETPEMFVKDIHSILDNLVNDTISPNSSQKELIMKAKKLVDDANEHIQLLSKDFHKKCWYFYLFQKSILFNQTTPNSNPYEDFEADTLMSPDILSDDDLILQSTPTSQKTVQIIIPKSPSATSSQLSTLFRRKLVMELVQKTLGFSIQELEDLGILLASYAASNGTITMQDVSNALNIL